MEQATRRTHTDGPSASRARSACPTGFSPAAKHSKRRRLRCQFDIRFEWWAHYRAWFVLQPPGPGGGGIRLRYCPFCGTRLRGVGQPGGRWLQPELLED